MNQMNQMNSDAKGTLIHTSDLKDILQYKNDNVISNFMDEWEVSKEEAQDLFNEMLKFLYLAGVCKEDCFHLQIDTPILMIDKMWHTFVLFTADYHDFCMKYFGAILHHVPFSKEDLKRKMDVVQSRGISFNQAKRETLEFQLNKIVSYLGRETLEKWYVEYAEKYSPEIINSLVKKPVHGDALITSRKVTSNMALNKSDLDLIDAIIQVSVMTVYCGTNCGAYCSCNSRSSGCF